MQNSQKWTIEFIWRRLAIEVSWTFPASLWLLHVLYYYHKTSTAVYPVPRYFFTVNTVDEILNTAHPYSLVCSLAAYSGLTGSLVRTNKWMDWIILWCLSRWCTIRTLTMTWTGLLMPQNAIFDMPIRQASTGRNVHVQCNAIQLCAMCTCTSLLLDVLLSLVASPTRRHPKRTLTWWSK